MNTLEGSRKHARGVRGGGGGGGKGIYTDWDLGIGEKPSTEIGRLHGLDYNISYGNEVNNKTAIIRSNDFNVKHAHLRGNNATSYKMGEMYNLQSNQHSKLLDQRTALQKTQRSENVRKIYRHNSKSSVSGPFGAVVPRKFSASPVEEVIDYTTFQPIASTDFISRRFSTPDEIVYQPDSETTAALPNIRNSPPPLREIKVRERSTKPLIRSLQKAPGLEQKYDVSPQTIPTRPQTAPRLFQAPPGISNLHPGSVPSRPASAITKLSMNTSTVKNSRLLSATQPIRQPQQIEKGDPFTFAKETTTPLNHPLRQLKPGIKNSAITSKANSSQPNKGIIIIDMGPYYVRAGFLRDQPTEPDLFLPHAIGMDQHGVHFGKAVTQLDGVSVNDNIIALPLRWCQITSPARIRSVPVHEDFFRYIFDQLKITEKEKHYKLLLCLPARASALRPHFIGYFFGSISPVPGLGSVESVATISAFRAALQTMKTSTCLIISLSADLEIIPLAEGALLESGRSTTALYGELALRSMMTSIKSQGIDLSEKEIACYGHYIYQKGAYIKNNIKDCHDVTVDLNKYTPYPCDRKICVSSEVRLDASDALLRPATASNHDGELLPFKKLLKKAIQACDVDLRSAICSNVVIIGEFADIEGFRERVGEEICALLPKGVSPPNVKVAANAAGSVYDGACILAALMLGPQAPHCPWFRYLNREDWSKMRGDNSSGATVNETCLLNRLNRDCNWP